MRTEKEIYDLVLNFAFQDERIRIVTLEGSRTKIITLSVQQKESLMTVVTNFGMLQHMYPRAYFVVKYYLQ